MAASTIPHAGSWAIRPTGGSDVDSSEDRHAMLRFVIQ